MPALMRQAAQMCDAMQAALERYERVQRENTEHVKSISTAVCLRLHRLYIYSHVVF